VSRISGIDDDDALDEVDQLERTTGVDVAFAWRDVEYGEDEQSVM